jgi:hypothetical protein
MLDENMRDQLVTVPRLARLLAADESFVCEIGLDEYESDEVILRLQLVIGFVLAIYNAAKLIFSTHRRQTLDDKFIELINSRLRLIPEIVEHTPETRRYAEHCYYEHRMKMGSEGCEKKWEDMTLYEQFFEVCVCVFREEIKLDFSDPTHFPNYPILFNLHLLGPELEEMASRDIIGKTFKGVFTHIKWGLDDEVDSAPRRQNQEVEQLDRVKVIRPGQVWPGDFRSHQRRFNRFSLAIAIVVAVLIGSLTVGYVTMKYSAMRVAIEDHKEATALYIKSSAKAIVYNDGESKGEAESAKERLERCEQKLKRLEGFWIKYENGWWQIRRKTALFTICLLSGVGATVAGFFAIRLLLAPGQMSEPAK